MSSKIKKIRVFLVACANCVTPQEINCDAISRHLDKNKFEVYTLLYIFNVNNAFKEDQCVNYLRLLRPVRLFLPILVFLGIMKSDVVYSPVGIMSKWTKFCISILQKKSFNTVEGLLDETALLKVKNVPEYIEGYRWYEPNLFAISTAVKTAVKTFHGLNCADEILYLGTEMSEFYHIKKEKSVLRNVVFIGRETIRKRIDEFLEMSKEFPKIQFHVVGGNKVKGGDTVEGWVLKNNSKNVIYHGEVGRKELTSLLKDMDVMFFPSRSEGFGKVTFECAASGVVPIVYGDYGAGDWIKTGKNGYVVDTYDEAVSAIKTMVNDSSLFNRISRSSSELGLSWDWKNIINIWEKVITRIASNQ